MAAPWTREPSRRRRCIVIANHLGGFGDSLSAAPHCVVHAERPSGVSWFGCALARSPTAPPMTHDQLCDLYRRYGPVIYSRCRALLHDGAAAEDATQETFVRVRQHLSRAPDGDTALFWIYRIATNYCLNQIRNRERQARPVAELPRGLAADPDPETRLVDRNTALRLIRAAPEPVRFVAVLYHLDGFEQDEVARIVGRSRRTVAKRLAQFKEAALQLLNGGGS